MKILQAITNNKDYQFELHGMNPQTIVELLGMENIADDQIENLQYYIDQAYFEQKAIIADAKAEFGL